MCGIVGELKSSGRISRSLFAEMRNTLRHRGPDDRADQFLNEDRVAIGHTRLSIIDPSVNGRQPMASDGKDVWVTFNGEIYNHTELRQQLSLLGHRFIGHSDTEVLLRAYLEWGENLVNRLSGMFAFAIWDQKTASFLLARDRFGIKPLYLYHTPHRSVFASEIKAILRDPQVPRRLDVDAIRSYFQVRYIPQPRTPWLDIEKIPPATCIRIDQYGNRRQWRYWEPAPERKMLPRSLAMEESLSLLNAAVGSQLSADTAVGMLLSGGLDSSSVLAMAISNGWRPETFTVGFDKWDLSEHNRAKVAADSFGVTHEASMLGCMDESDFYKATWQYDDLLGGTSFLPTLALSRMAGRRVKVALGGDGGDELLAGYNWYPHDPDAVKPGKAFILYVKAMSWLGMGSSDVDQLIPESRYGFDASAFLKQQFQPELGTRKALQLLDIHTFLPEVVLAKVDRASMAHGLEVRVPFLDNNFADFMLSLDESVYTSSAHPKPFLRSFLMNQVPTAFFNHVKQGFSAPLHIVFNHHAAHDAILNSAAIKDGFLSVQQVRMRLRDPIVAFAIRLFCAWYETWVHSTDKGMQFIPEGKD
jgi:asparagine synthase (glutamine-hydrolysing)